MYNNAISSNGTLHVNQSQTGQTIESQIINAQTKGEKLEGNSVLQYSERREGVKPQFDIRTDRFDVALDGFTKIEKSQYAKRQAKLEIVKDEEGNNSNGTNPSE
jgi:hypothetical protein